MIPTTAAVKAAVAAEKKAPAAMEAVKLNLEQKLREPLLRLVLEQPEATYFQDMFFFSSERLAR